MDSALGFAAIFAVSAAVPGPDTMLILGRTIERGVVPALQVALGVTLGKLVLLTLAVIGVAAAAIALGPLFLAVKICGAAYLIWMGVRLWRRAGDTPQSVAPGRGGLIRSVAVGGMLAMTNPQAILFYVAVLPQVLGDARPTLAESALLCLALVFVMALVAGAYVLVGLRTRRAVASRTGRGIIDRISGALLATIGVVVLAR